MFSPTLMHLKALSLLKILREDPPPFLADERGSTVGLMDVYDVTFAVFWTPTFSFLGVPAAGIIFL